MSKITILHEYPVVLTKDKQWFEINRPKMQPGAVIVLPEDAVLVIPPQIIEMKTMEMKTDATHFKIDKSAAAQKEVE